MDVGFVTSNAAPGHAMRVGLARTERPVVASRMALFVGAEPPLPALRAILAKEGVRSVFSDTVVMALASARAAVFDCAVIDLTGMNGAIAGVLSELRAVLLCPIIVVAQRRDEIDEVIALECGASVFLVHPVSPRCLSAYLQAQMRAPWPRSGDDGASTARPRPWTWAPAQSLWRLNVVTRSLWVGAACARLTATQCALTQCLLEASGSVVSRARLEAALLPRDAHSARAARSMDVYISRLRKRLASQGVDGSAIRTVPNHGYQLVFRERTTHPTG